MEYIRKDMDISEPQTPYAIISSNNHFRIVEFNEINFSFKNEIESVMEEVYFQCNTIAQEKCLSSRSWGDVRNFTDIIEVCHELQQLNYFDDSYITILSEMQYYYNNIDTLEFDNLSFDKKKKIIKSFNEFLQTFPTYINECYI